MCHQLSNILNNVYDHSIVVSIVQDMSNFLLAAGFRSLQEKEMPKITRSFFEAVGNRKNIMAYDIPRTAHTSVPTL